MKINKKLLLICIFSISLCLLAGCGSSQKSDVPAATEEPAASPEPTATPAPITPEKAAASDTPSLTAFSDYDDVFTTVQEMQSVEETKAGSSSLASALSSEGLTESDVLRVSGELIYALSEKDLTIYRLGSESGELLSTTRVGTAWSSSTDDVTGTFTGSEKTPLAIFLNGTRLAVILDIYGYEGTTGTVSYSEYVGVDIYDVSNASNPVYLTSCGQDGVFSDAWMSDGTLCVATKYSVYDADDVSDTEAYIPAVYSGETASLADASNLYRASFIRSGDCAVFGAYSLENASQTGVAAIYGVDMDNVRAVPGSLFLTETCNISAESRSMSDETGDYTEYAAVACTELYRFDYDASGIRLAVSAAVNGMLPEKNAIARTDSGYILFTEQIGSYYKQYSDGEIVTTQELNGGVLYLLDDSLACIAKCGSLPDGSEIVWAGIGSNTVLVSGENTSYTVDAAALTISEQNGGSPISADILLPWRDNGYAAFRQESAGQMTLTLYDASLRKTAERTFGSDFSNTLENLDSYIVLPEQNLLGFSADDSYCLYSEDGGEIAFCTDIFLNDWAWNARTFESNGNLIIADCKEAFVYLPDTLEIAATYTFDNSAS